MTTFNSRIEAQRCILRVINGKLDQSEELFGLSRDAIKRWLLANRYDPNGNLVQLVILAADKLFFLANRSQETVSDDYRAVSDQILSIIKIIEQELH